MSDCLGLTTASSTFDTVMSVDAQSVSYSQTYSYHSYELSNAVYRCYYTTSAYSTSNTAVSTSLSSTDSSKMLYCQLITLSESAVSKLVSTTSTQIYSNSSTISASVTIGSTSTSVVIGETHSGNISSGTSTLYPEYNVITSPYTKSAQTVSVSIPLIRSILMSNTYYGNRTSLSFSISGTININFWYTSV